jgi:hypothetical protein
VNTQQALREAGSYTLYFFHTLLSHGNIANLERQRERGYLRAENRHLLYSFQGFRHLTLEDIERTELRQWF